MYNDSLQLHSHSLGTEGITKKYHTMKACTIYTEIYNILTFIGISGTLLSFPTVGYWTEVTFQNMCLSVAISNLNVDRSTDKMTYVGDCQQVIYTNF